MQTVAEVMTREVQVVSPEESLQRAAQLMGELDVGALPVFNGEQLVGMVTDRDITIRGTAAGLPPHETHINEVMTPDIRWCFEDQPLDEVMIQMADSQVRRIPVLSHDDQRKLVGIVSLGDVATKTRGDAQKHDVEQVVEMVSSPSAAGGGAAAPIDSVAGQTGSGGGGDMADAGGVDMPSAGESGIGAAGASGQPPDGPQVSQSGGDPTDSDGISVLQSHDPLADGLPPP